MVSFRSCSLGGRGLNKVMKINCPKDGEQVVSVTLISHLEFSESLPFDRNMIFTAKCPICGIRCQCFEKEK